MESQELRLFRNYPTFHEPVFKLLTDLSIRNLIVIGLFGALSYGLSKLLVSETHSFTDQPVVILIIIIPALIGLFLGLSKTQFGSSDSIFLSILYVLYQNSKKNNSKKSKKKKRSKSTVLQFGEEITPKDISEQNRVREIICSDFDELKSVKLLVLYNNGNTYADKVVKCYLDDILIDTRRTSLDGLLSVVIKPEREGIRKLIVKENDNEKILLEKTFNFKSSK